VKTGVKDTTGNAVTAFSSTFQTGPGPDLDRPSVQTVSPVSNTEPTNSVVAMTFSEPLDPASVVFPDTFSLTVNNTGVQIAGALSLDAGNTRLAYVPSAPLTPSTLYRICVNTGIQDVTGNGLNFNSCYNFTTSANTDSTAPTVVATDPANASTNVPRNAVITVQMSEPIDDTLVTSANVFLKHGGTDVPGSIELLDANRRIRFHPSLPLLKSTSYTLTVTGVRDTAGNQLAAPTNLNFTTGLDVDLVQVGVVTSDPPANATGVSKTIAPTVQFSEPVDAITVNPSTGTRFGIR